ncbi:MAG: TonB-dependent receptor, partial [Holophagales bacterium]|nr:TonB-dependent receptor [Holophagales bacterium]
RFATFDLAEIQVAKGFSSVAFGPNTLGGAINLITKKPSKKFEGNAILGTADGDGKTAAVNIGSSMDKFYIQAGGSLRDSGNFRMSTNFIPTPSAEGGWRSNSDFKDSKFSAKIGFAPDSSGEYVIGYMLQKGQKGQPVATEGSRSSQFWRWPTWDKDDIYFLSHNNIGADTYLKVRAYYDTFKNIIHMFTNATFSELRNDGISIYDDYTNGAILEVGTTFFDNHSIRAIAQIKRDVHRSDDNSNNWKSYKDQLSSVGIEDSIIVNNKLNLSLGIGLDIQKALEIGEYARYGNFSHQFLQGQFGAFWKMNEKVHTYFTVSRKDRFPTLRDRFSLRFDRNIPNPELQPELSTNYDIGAKAFLTSWLRIEGAVFYSGITDLIEEVVEVAVSEDGRPLSQFQNVGKVKSQGVELSFYIKPVSWFENGIYYTYLHRENKSAPGIRLRGVPKNRITGFTKIEPVKQLNVIASLECQDNVWDTNTGRLAGYTTANLTIGYMLAKDIQIEGGFSNILDKNYQQTLGFPLPGRTWFVNARCKF